MNKPTHARMIKAVFKRNFLAYFINPTGYVFITVFILLGAIAAFWQTAFFMNNLANLDQLNAFFPILLLFFIPALTMNVWAEERRQGTDELLFTLPGHDIDIVLGKYLAVLGIYTVAVLFSLSHVVILAWLGEPDIGLMFGTYLGYWLTGAAMLSVGMTASLLTSNTTVAFILGAAFCSVFIFIEHVETIFGKSGSEFVSQLAIADSFRDFGDGVITLSGILYFLGLIVVMLYINMVFVGRRHLSGGEGSMAHAVHFVTRGASLAVVVIAVFVLAERTGVYADVTAERLHTLQPQSLALIDEIPDNRPVFIQAFFSPDVPESYVRTHKNLLNTLHRLDALGGDRIQVVIHDTQPYTENAAEASDNYNIIPRPLMEVAASQRSTREVFLGLVFTSGPEEFVIPFFDRGLPVEYELIRSVRVVMQSERKKLGIVTTDAKLFGGFDFQTMSSTPDWSIVSELRKQYEVRQIAPAGPYPDDLDVLLVVLPSSMAQGELDRLQQAIYSGTPTLIFDDPMPLFNPQLAASLPKDAGRNPFTNQNQPPPPPKGDFDSLLASIGLIWRNTDVIWSGYNPHPGIADVAPEVVFITTAPDNARPFNDDSTISSGLQEMVMIYPGYLRAAQSIEGASLIATILVQTGVVSGQTEFNSLVTRSFFGMQLNPNPRRIQTPDAYNLAIHVTGTIPSPDESESDAPHHINVIMVSDIDCISETFFDMRRRGFSDFNFDNVTFALNCIDTLAGDESFVTLRKHRPRHRSLTLVEQRNRAYTDKRRDETDKAEIDAQNELQLAQQNLSEKVGELRNRSDLDEQTKAIMLRNLEEVENRRLSVVEATIEQNKKRSLARAENEMNIEIARIQRGIKWWATILPPIPTLILALAFFVHRRNREKTSVSERRHLEATSS
ncbi:MAG: Gldg family protein [Planctomycetes bacterium]|nr:Gldg family protein [Planctomycetota bacterium]